MRFNLWRVLAVFALCFIVSCGGGGGGGSAPIPTPIASDPGVASAANAVLASAVDPDAQLQRFLAELERVYDEESDPNKAADTIVKTYLDAIQTSGDMFALYQVGQNTPPIFASMAEDDTVQVQGAVLDSCHRADLEDVVIYFVNGIWNTPWDALESRQALASAWVKERAPDFPKSKVRLFYNRTGTDGATIDTFCGMSTVSAGVFEQFAIASAWQRIHDTICGLANGAADVEELTNQWTQQWLPFDPGFSHPDILMFRRAIEQDVMSGRAVVIVAHSQGNFIAQQAVDYLPSDEYGDMRKAVGIVALASPAYYTQKAKYGYFSHLTLQKDLVTFSLPPTLSANGENDFSRSSASPLTIHNFLKSYLGSSESRQLILNKLRDATEVVGSSLAGLGRVHVGQGVFQVTMTTDSVNGQFDLHVFEPDGRHVFYEAPIGNSGELDQDGYDTVPENYFVCSQGKLMLGAYRIEVSNYNADPGAEVTLVVRAGTQIRTFRTNLGEVDFGATRKAVIEVTYRSDGTFLFGPISGGVIDETGGI